MRTPYGKLVALTLVLTLALLLIVPMRVDRDEFINLYPQRLHMTAGDSYALEYQLFAETPQQVRFSSANENIATVNEAGEITAVGAGTTRIRADAEGGARAAMRVRVEAALPPSVGLTLNAESMDLEKGQISGLRAIFDEEAENTLVEWHSSDENVARVDAIGRVQAVGGGTARIIAATPDGLTASAEVRVHVTGTAMHITPSELTVGTGATFPLSAYYLPEDATDAVARWDTSDDSILSVRDNGMIRARGEGQAVISVFSENGLFGSTLVKVEKAAERFEISPTAVTIERGNSLKLEPRFLDADGAPDEEASTHYVDWSSSDPEVATVSGGEVVGLRSGSARITAAVDGMTATCDLRVEILAHEVRLDRDEVTLERRNARQPIQLTASILPADADNQAIAWSTDNELVAVVDENGLVTMMGGYGTATITARAASGAEARFVVNVITDNP